MANHIDTTADEMLDAAHPQPRVDAYAWVAFTLTFGLMLSDYLSRQVINAVFPLLKAEWSLSDAQLGSLVSVIALTVGMMSFPISLLADRWGRVRSITIMATVWGLATIACGLSGNFLWLLVARAFVGLGEAGYSPAGGAVLTAVFPRRLHASVAGAFLAATLFGSVLGVVIGGVIAKHLGWQMAFILVGVGGLVLALLYPFVVKEPARALAQDERPMPLREVLRELFRTRTMRLTCVASGLQMFVVAALTAWLPSFLNRYHGLDPAQSAINAGVLVLVAGIGMVGGGALVDRLSRGNGVNRLRVPAVYSALCTVVLLAAFSLPPGMFQLVLIGLGFAIGSGFAGPSGAVVADVTHPAIRATVFATLTLANNFLGFAPGPFLTGLLADSQGLDHALQLVPLVALGAATCYWLASRSYLNDRWQTNPINHRQLSKCRHYR